LLALLVGLLGRSLYLQRIDHDFLQEQGSSRYSRDIDVPAHRGRIVDRFGEPLAISTPVKAVWAWPDQVVATPDQLRALAAALEMTPALLNQKLAQGGDFVYVKRPVAPEVADRAAALKVKGVHDESEYWRYYPGGEVMSHIVGFTGDRDVGQEGLELAQQSWLGGKPGSRRVIINRRGEIVEDIKSIRAPQEGRDLALSIDSRLQYLAFREIKAAVDANKAHAGAAVMLDVKSGEILALVNWPSYNPNNRMRTTRDRMRNRALIDTFEPGSTLKPFTIAAALDAGKVRPGSIIDTAPGTLTIGHATIHDAHREGDHGLRTRHFGQPGAAGTRLHGVRDRRRAQARVAAQGRRRDCRSAGDQR
jgi:cell division protein FtsI (penicillin-binding protein 3)